MPNKTICPLCKSVNTTSALNCHHCNVSFAQEQLSNRPNKTPRQSLRGQWEQEADGHRLISPNFKSMQEQITSKDGIKLPTKEQVAKQPDDMPDVIYALKDDYQTFWTPTPIDSFTPYIRKSIHDELVESYRQTIRERTL